MIPKECKRLAEVDFPIAEVSRHASREKSIRYGHPSTLHLWWARLPLASCRAMLMALLLPDPCDEHCPDDFKKQARDILLNIHGRPGGWEKKIKTDLGLRQTILRFIADFSNWDRSSDVVYLEAGRGLVNAAHPDEPPLVVDPFAGGGSIPLEALRIGCEAFASDLNPVACLILKVMLEDIPLWGNEKVKVKRQNGEEVEAEGLVEALRIVGKGIKAGVEKELAEFYPKDPDGARPIAYLWVRTVKCEAPDCGAEIPLMRSFWLSKKVNRKRALRYMVDYPEDKAPQVKFEIFEPKNDKEVPGPTVTRAKATCLACNTVLSSERVRAQLAGQRGGADVVFDKNGDRNGGAKIIAMVIVHPGKQAREYRLPAARDYEPVWKAHMCVTRNAERKFSGETNNYPDEGTPWKGGHRSVVSLRAYGINEWGDLFTARQKIGVATIVRLIHNHTDMIPAVSEFSGLALSRFTDICNACCRWDSTKTQVRNLFTRQELPIMWDFAESSLLTEQAGDYSTTLNTMIRVVEKLRNLNLPGQVNRADARDSSLPNDCASVWFTDPPYYDAVAYADLSDFFYVWLKRTLSDHPLLASGVDKQLGLCPKTEELTVTTKDAPNSIPKTRSYFESGMADVFTEGRRVLKNDGIGSVVFAHKTTEGWDALLAGMISGGLTITGSWPLSTELGTRVNARENVSLATSVHLVCRPRPGDAPTGDWADVLNELPRRVGDWMKRLQNESIRGADLVFACIGPALEIYSRYSRVETAEGREIDLAEYLERVWEVVGRTALEQILGTEEAKARSGAAGALEEDARLTALFLWTLQSTNGESTSNGNGDGMKDTGDDEKVPGLPGKSKGFSLIYDLARRFAQPLGINMLRWEGRIIETKKGIVRLLPISERTKHLFGIAGAKTVAERVEIDPAPSLQLSLFPELSEQPSVVKMKTNKRSRGRIQTENMSTDHETTTLDRLHAAMILQSNGMTNALRTHIKTEQERGPHFLRLANALSALYPRGSEEKRLLDAMLLAVQR